MNKIEPYRERRPWGGFEEFVKNDRVTVKILTVDPREAFSLQTHEKRDEFWRVISGSGFITIGDTRAAIAVDREYHIPAGTRHRLEAGDEAIKVLEIALGEFDEEDIIRLEDKYGRN